MSLSLRRKYFDFMKGIDRNTAHHPRAPYHPQLMVLQNVWCTVSNRHPLKANKYSKPVQHKLNVFLLAYTACLHAHAQATTDQSPLQLMFGQNVCKKLDLVKLNVGRTVNSKLFSNAKNLIDVLTRDNKCWSGITGQRGNGYRERLLFKQSSSSLCHTESVKTIRSGDGMSINCVHAGPRFNHDPGFEAEAECEETTNFTSTCRESPSQDEVAITKVVRQTDTTADGNASNN